MFHMIFSSIYLKIRDYIHIDCVFFVDIVFILNAVSLWDSSFAVVL